jgi:hypothetical protein
MCHSAMACGEIVNARVVAAGICRRGNGGGGAGGQHSHANACEHMRSHSGENTVPFIMSVNADGTPNATNNCVADDDSSGRNT